MKPHLPRAILIIVLTLALDQTSKMILKDLLLPPEGPRQIILTSFFNLTPVWNHGVSFGLMQASHTWHTTLLILITLGITLFLTRWLYQAPSRLTATGLSLAIGGAIGNIVDRTRFGAVFDFLDVHLYGYHWPAFNIADSAVCIGLFLLLIDTGLSHRLKDKQ